jgi:hypothetical protein
MVIMGDCSMAQEEHPYGVFSTRPFLFALGRLSVQAKTENGWLWLAWEDRQRFTVPYAERLSKGGYAVQAGLPIEATILLGQAIANHQRK